MFEFFGGVPERIILDNLKSGIIKPDLYDPSLNRSYREMTEHYGTFVDPARIRHPKDKAKVERDVQTVREALRMQIVLHPGAGLGELARLMKQWSLNDYGGRKHGTTHEQPYQVFCQRERPALKTLPAERFEVALWKQATVHPDHYIQFQGKAYSIPHAYLGKKVWVRATEHLLRVFYNDRLIKQHLITKAYRHTDHSDFPENVRAVLDTSTTHRLLLERALRFGQDFHQLIRDLLQAHAYLNLRRAQGLVAVAEASNRRINSTLSAMLRSLRRVCQRHHLLHQRTGTTTMNDQIIQQLRILKLPGFREHLQARIMEAEANNLSYEDFLSMLLADEFDLRTSRRIERLLHRAHLGKEMTLDTFDFSFNPSINAKRIKALASCRFIEHRKTLPFRRDTVRIERNKQSSLG